MKAKLNPIACMALTLMGETVHFRAAARKMLANSVRSATKLHFPK